MKRIYLHVTMDAKNMDQLGSFYEANRHGNDFRAAGCMMQTHVARVTPSRLPGKESTLTYSCSFKNQLFFLKFLKKGTALCRLNYEWNIDIFLVYFFFQFWEKKYVHLPPHHPRDFLAGLYLQFLQIFYKLFPSAQPGLRTPPTTDLCFTLPTFSCCCMCL